MQENQDEKQIKIDTSLSTAEAEETLGKTISSSNHELLDEEDVRKLKMAHYESKKDQFPNTYVLLHKNKRSRDALGKRVPGFNVWAGGKIAEIKANSSIHACKMLGWRPRNVRVLEERKGE